MRGRTQLDPTDGLHRLKILRERREYFAFAAIKPNSSPTDIVKLRISATKDHPSVRFPRMVQFLDDGWNLTPWSKEGITLTQAFTLRFSRNKLVGRNLHLSPDDVTDIRSWVDESSVGSGLSATTAYGIFLTAQVADPELVMSVRERKNGDTLTALTGDHLAKIARPPTLAHKYDLQNTLAEAIISESLTVVKTEQLVSAVIRRGAQTPGEIRTIFEDGIWKFEEAEPMSGKRRRKKTASAPEEGLAIQVAEALARAQTAEGERDVLAKRLEAIGGAENSEARLAAVAEGYEAQIAQAIRDRDTSAIQMEVVNTNNLNLALENKQLRAENTALKEARARSVVRAEMPTLQKARPTTVNPRPPISGQLPPQPERRAFAPTPPPSTESELPSTEGPDMEKFLAMTAKEVDLLRVDLYKFESRIPHSVLSRDRAKAIRFIASGIKGFTDYQLSDIDYLLSEEVIGDLTAVSRLLWAKPEDSTVNSILGEMVEAFSNR